MFATIRRAWRSYFDSIPKPDEPERISDEQIFREHFRPPPVPQKNRSAFDDLADIVVMHLPTELANSKARQLKAKLKPGVEPAEALSDWIQLNCSPKSRVGIVALDWKAREEVEWQAKLLIRAHGIPLAWQYDFRTDTEWLGWQERDEAPVETPLKSLARALLPHEVVLCRFSIDDGVYAFAVNQARLAAILEHCAVLGIELKDGT